MRSEGSWRDCLEGDGLILTGHSYVLLFFLLLMIRLCSSELLESSFTIMKGRFMKYQCNDDLERTALNFLNLSGSYIIWASTMN